MPTVPPGIAPPPKARTAGQSSNEMDERSLHLENPKTADLAANTAEPGLVMSSNQGVKISDDQNSLKAGPRGPTLMEDFHLREKITHFDHERIPERVVHARGAAAHGLFRVYEDLTPLTKAKLFSDPSKTTPVFVRFSTVVGSRGSTDTPRDVRGFAVKFYTDEGIWDLVGNNMPVFFIQDAVKFPDLIHAVKPEPHHEIPQAQSAHDTFWDFASLTPESAHMLMWVMSDRALPRSYATMEGFGVHTFRLVNFQGQGRFVKFHWKPLKGVQSLVWDEAQKLSGKDPDFNRRDLFEAIERGDYPQWELGFQIVEEKDEHNFDFDLLDPTKIIPEELVPIQRVGRLTLNRNPDNFFAETEQVAFHAGHVVPGIDFTNDPLLQGRLFSYIDTQLRRVGPNFAELPINRPLNPVHNNQREGMARQTIDRGRVAYFPNSLGGGCPMHQPGAGDAFRTYTEKVEGKKIRERSASFNDHFSQATMFWNSMSDWEKEHIAEAFAFELNQVENEVVRARTMNELLVNIHEDLAEAVSQQTGIAVSPAGTPQNPTPSAPTPAGPLTEKAKKLQSPALSMDRPVPMVKGKKIAILAGPGADSKQLALIQSVFAGNEIVAEIVASHAGVFEDSDGKEHKVNRAAPNAPSVIYDGAIIPHGVGTDLADSGLTVHFVREAFKHGKPLAAVGDGHLVFKEAALPQTGPQYGVIVGDAANSVLDKFVDALKQRFPRRDISSVAA